MNKSGCDYQNIDKGIASKCCPNTTVNEDSGKKKRLLIEFMYIDLQVCVRCMGTDTVLEEAIAEVTSVLKAAGYEIEVRKILVTSEKQAEALNFISSPTIRINGQDIQLDAKESLCESCGDVAGEDIDCRVWSWEGKEYSQPPKAMLVDALLRHVYGGRQPAAQAGRAIPENLKRFFAAKRKMRL
ncbi:DUF2703 domain-containing protein [Pectinatus brassicae]|uniref:Glutaredoxin n=1 Tax=Pectinatus brassicae TaxID=862415 RepID=A0A840UF16_9FIRM|nr:DUF2703 domain-containing protein [Pectinatus brassicae]MBB5335696.1 glutaredoxin [Pectinatus brassicae]